MMDAPGLLRESTDSQHPTRWVWLFPPVYLAHLIDERFYGIGTAEWASHHTGVCFSNAAWLAVNVPSFLLLTLAAWLVARRSWPLWVAVALATHVGIHGVGRVVGSLVFESVSPGVVTGVIACLPLALFTYMRTARVLSRGQLLAGFLVGVATLQPLWHGLLLSVLPSGGPAA